MVDDIAPGVISREATYQLQPHSDSFPGVISFESIRVQRARKQFPCSLTDVHGNVVKEILAWTPSPLSPHARPRSGSVLTGSGAAGAKAVSVGVPEQHESTSHC
jgi:hypothetical protein